MKKRKIPENLKHGLAIFFLIGIIFVGLYGTRVWADNPTEFVGQGYAYGSINDGGSSAADTGIGYISFGCVTDGSCAETNDYSVRINTDPDSPDEGKFSGYAWSSNYGWVSFNESDVLACGPEGAVKIVGNVQNFIGANTSQTVPLSGYARVLNNDPGYWDGCIKFVVPLQDNSTTYATKITKLTSGELQLIGYAWGSNVIGWINFDCEHCGVTFEPNNVPDTPDVCPQGTTGTPPNCESCPPGSTDPNCVPPVCPPGYTGTPPNCCPPASSGGGGPSPLGGGTTGQNCQPSARSNVLLHIGEGGAPQNQIVGNSTYTITIEDLNQAEQVTLIPQALGLGVHSCSATSSSSLGNGGATVTGWTTNALASLPTPFLANDLTHEFDVFVSGYSDGEVITLKINCLSTTTNIPVSAEVFIIVGTVPAIVSIDADPTSIDLLLDPAGTTTLSWNFSNVEQDSCSIAGVYDDPDDGTDELITMNQGFANSIDAGYLDQILSGSNDSGNDDLFGIGFAMVFTINCNDYQGNPVSDFVLITTIPGDCPPALEAAGYCDNDINPIFEEF